MSRELETRICKLESRRPRGIAGMTDAELDAAVCRIYRQLGAAHTREEIRAHFAEHDPALLEFFNEDEARWTAAMEGCN
jgi:hypothetical protein